MLLIIRGTLRISLPILITFKRIDYFQVCLALEAKFGVDSLSNFWRFKQVQGKSRTRRNNWSINKTKQKKQ